MKDINTMSLFDLTLLKSIIEKRLLQIEKWRDCERGHNLDEYNRRNIIYHNDDNHAKLNRINQRIDDFINII
jgi:hypothetical protein